MALAHQDMLPQWILVREVLPDHGFIHQGHALGILVVVLVEQAALPQRDPHGVEVAGRGRAEVRQRLLILRHGWPAFDRKPFTPMRNESIETRNGRNITAPAERTPGSASTRSIRFL
jgi:hypothetical protein